MPAAKPSLTAANTGRKAARLARPVASRPMLGVRDYVERMNLDQLPEMIPVARIAEMTSMSRSTIYMLVSTGELSGVRLGPGALRVFRQSLIDFIQRSIE